MRRRNRQPVEPIPLGVWMDALSGGGPQYDEAVSFLLERGHGVVNILRARIAHRRKAGCPCPEHDDAGLPVVSYGADRDTAIDRWRSQRAMWGAP